MPELDFCKLEVTVIHSLQAFSTAADKFKNVAAVSRYFSSADQNAWAKEIEMVNSTDPNLVMQVQFDNTQLNCELKVVDSIEDQSDKFQFKVWNIPEGIIFNIGDYLLFKWYWDADSAKYTEYHGIVKDVKSKRTFVDLETTIKGELTDQNIMYGWSMYNKYPKLTYYSDVKSFVENELQLEFISMIPGFSQRTPLPEPILTRGKSVGVVMEQICAQLTKTVLSTGDTARWKFINGQTILIYRDSDLKSRNSTILNEYFKITVPTIQYNDILEFTDKGDGKFTMQVFGLPATKAGIAMYVDTARAPAFVTAESAYYIIDEVEHNITLADGYIMKAYVRKTQ